MVYLGMTRYALYLWDVDGKIHVYDLGENNLDRAEMIARDIMANNHEEFEEEDNPCWQVDRYNGVEIHLDD